MLKSQYPLFKRVLSTWTLHHRELHCTLIWFKRGLLSTKTASNYFVFEFEMRIPTGHRWRAERATAESNFLISLRSVSSPSPNTATIGIKRIGLQIELCIRGWGKQKGLESVCYFSKNLSAFFFSPPHIERFNLLSPWTHRHLLIIIQKTGTVSH